jgi:hypothetical protein
MRHWQLSLLAAAAAATSIPLLEPFTIKLPNASITNTSQPFNCSNLGTSLAFTAPSGRVTTVLPFLTQDFTRSQGANGAEVLVPSSAPYFAARFAPTELGEHSYAQVRAPRGVTPVNGTFTCAGGPAVAGDGFARVAPGGAYFTLDGTRAFWLVGENMAWSGCYPYFNGSCAFDDEAGGTFMYDRLLPALAAVGGNWVRLWVGPSLVREVDMNGERSSFLGLALQGVGTTFGEYSLAAAWRLDYVVALARALGIKITLVGEAQQSFAPEAFWNASAYNVANGGPLGSATNLWAAPQVAAELAQRWDFLVARAAHSSSIFSWELQNEAQDWPGGFSSAALAVQLALLERLRAGDGYAHMVESSFSGKSGSGPQIAAFNGDARVAFTSVHAYPNPDFQLPCDVAATVWRAVAPNARSLGKPCFLEEFGATYLGPEQHALDPTGVGLRTGSWASLVGGAAGTAMQWYWAEMDTLNTYSQLAGAATVSRSLAVPLLALAWAPSPGTFAAPAALAGWGVGSDRATNASAAVLAYACVRGGGEEARVRSSFHAVARRSL